MLDTVLVVSVVVKVVVEESVMLVGVVVVMLVLDSVAVVLLELVTLVLVIEVVLFGRMAPDHFHSSMLEVDPLKLLANAR